LSRRNVDIVRAFFVELREQGTRLEWLHPTVQWHVQPDLPDAGVYRDHDGYRQLAARFDEVVADQHYQPLDFIDAGANVVVPLRWTAPGRLSGASFVERVETWVFTVTGGAITTVVEFPTREAVLEAVARRE
jgi:ketosteroid isomerase-like protein